MVLLDSEKQKDEKKLSYQLRPLVRHKYVTKRSDNLYSLTQKGKDCIPNSEPLVKCGGDVNSRKRAATISGVAALLATCGISGSDSLPKNGENVFIPAPKWRSIRAGLLSTVRFAGMLFWEKERFAVYDIGDGSMQWQLFAERSLFFVSYGSYETRATGILFLCDNGKCIEISQQIIRQTMWHRKTLLPLGNGLYFESDKKRKVAKSPIKLHEQYKKVFLCEKQNLEIQFERMHQQAFMLNEMTEKLGGVLSKNCDIEVYPQRYFLNFDNDLLKWVRLFNAVKSNEAIKKCDYSPVIYNIYTLKNLAPIAAMYALPLEVSCFEIRSINA